MTANALATSWRIPVEFENRRKPRIKRSLTNCLLIVGSMIQKELL